MSAPDGKALLKHGHNLARRYAKRLGPDVAEELQAEAMARALRKPSPDGRMEPWLERIYRNLMIDWSRRQRPMAIDVDELSDLAQTGTPEDVVLLCERRRLVRASLRRLPREFRRVMLSRYYAELDEGTIATRFGIAGTTVRTRIHRALARLRVGLGELRAFCPPLFARLAGQLASVGLVPVVVAALLVVGALAPEPQLAPPLSPMASVGVHTNPSMAPREAFPAPVPPAKISRSHARMPKKATATERPVALALKSDSDDRVVADILWPEQIDIFLEPERPASECLVMAPASFAPQIEKMIEDEL